MRRTWQLEKYAQTRLGLLGSFFNEEESTLVYEEYQHRYNSIHVDPAKFERHPA